MNVPETHPKETEFEPTLTDLEIRKVKRAIGDYRMQKHRGSIHTLHEYVIGKRDTIYAADLAYGLKKLVERGDMDVASKVADEIENHS